MLRNYLKIIVRNLKLHKGYSFLNVFGLAIGIAVAGLILLYVQYEWQYDRFYPDSDRIYRVIQKQKLNTFMGSDYFAVTQEPLGRTLKAEYPEVESYVTLADWENVVVKVDSSKIFDENILYATAPNLFKIFSYEFVKGDPNTALSELNTVVLSEKAARKFFGSENPIGKILKVSGDYLWKVTGIYKSFPANSQFSGYGLIISFATYSSIEENNYPWGNSSWYTYLLLRKNADPALLQSKLPAVVKKYIDKSQNVNELPRQFILQPLTDIHLFSKANFQFGEVGDIKTVIILAALAFMILLIACINYTNLSTARATLRAREVGVRKVIGANKKQLIAQFIGESVLLSYLAGVLALIIVELLLPDFSRLTGLNLPHTYLLKPDFILGFALLILFVGILSGAYPAFVLSIFEPVRVLKGDRLKSDTPSLRQILVVVQFSASIALIICTLIILSQMNFIRTMDMGYNRNNIIVLKINDPSIREHLEIIKQRLNQVSSIQSTTAVSRLPVNISSATSIDIPGKNGGEGIPAYLIFTDPYFLKTFDIPIVEGRDFSARIAADSAGSILINQTLEKSLGFDKTIGKILTINGHKLKIIGVLKDFNLHSVRHKIQPLFVALYNPWKQYLCIKISSKDIPGSIEKIKSVWDYYAAQRPFEYTFLDTDFNQLYSSEERLSQIVSYSSGLAIFIACLGLLGLVAFIVEQRRKEIGIRKVLGATMADVLRLLSSQFIKLIIVANVIAWPIAYYLMSKWLSGFVYRINQELWPFVITGISVLIIAVAAVSSLAIKAANTNPANTLRYE